jgi:hypothetical protein
MAAIQPINTRGWLLATMATRPDAGPVNCFEGPIPLDSLLSRAITLGQTGPALT